MEPERVTQGFHRLFITFRPASLLPDSQRCERQVRVVHRAPASAYASQLSSQVTCRWHPDDPFKFWHVRHTGCRPRSCSGQSCPGNRRLTRKFSLGWTCSSPLKQHYARFASSSGRVIPRLSWASSGYADPYYRMRRAWGGKRALGTIDGQQGARCLHAVCRD